MTLFTTSGMSSHLVPVVLSVRAMLIQVLLLCIVHMSHIANLSVEYDDFVRII